VVEDLVHHCRLEDIQEIVEDDDIIITTAHKCQDITLHLNLFGPIANRGGEGRRKKTHIDIQQTNKQKHEEEDNKREKDDMAAGFINQNGCYDMICKTICEYK